MAKYLIEGACDGGLFSETVDANSREDAEAFAIQRLCEAWGEEYGPETTLDDLGDCAIVTEYSAVDYARDAAFDLVEQIARMVTTSEAGGSDLGNDQAMDGLIKRARAIVKA